MNEKLFIPVIIFVLILDLSYSLAQKQDYLLKVTDPVREAQAYVSMDGDTVIPAGKYHCFTDTFRDIAFVYQKGRGTMAINRQDEFLFNVFPYDNGPDYLSDGLFRIFENDRIGYANMKGEVVIEPRFKCAYPFENGKARVSNDCQKARDGEHVTWDSDSWYYINKQGEKIEE